MQSSNDCAVRVRELAFTEGVERYIVAQHGAQTVEVACFMGRGDPLPVAVPVRDFGNEDGCGLPSACPGAGAIRATRPAIVATAVKKNARYFVEVPPSNMLQ
jgi:hypothetical protein